MAERTSADVILEALSIIDARRKNIGRLFTFLRYSIDFKKGGFSREQVRVDKEITVRGKKYIARIYVFSNTNEPRIHFHQGPMGVAETYEVGGLPPWAVQVVEDDLEEMLRELTKARTEVLVEIFKLTSPAGVSIAGLEPLEFDMEQFME